MRRILILLALAGCTPYPELARAPAEPMGEPPPLVPLASIEAPPIEQDVEGDAALEARAAALRARAAALPTDPIEPETRAAMEAVRQR